MIALSILIASTLSASLSFGTYKSLFRGTDVVDTDLPAEQFRRSLFIFNLLIFASIIFIQSFYDPNNLRLTIFILIFLACDYLIHDETRLILYAGKRYEWAKELFLRNTFVIFVPIICFAIGAKFDLLILSIFFLMNLLYSYKSKNLFYKSLISFRMVLSLKFYRSLSKHIFFFFHSSISKFNTQLDRYIFGLLYYEIFWLYSILSQLSNFPVTYFEMSSLSRTKSKIVHEKENKFELLTFKELIGFVLLALLSIFGYIIFSFFEKTLLSFDIIYLFGTMIFTALIVNISMRNSERVFWKFSKSKDILFFEFKPLLLTLPFVGLIIYFDMPFQVRVALAFLLCLKIKASRRILKVQ